MKENEMVKIGGKLFRQFLAALLLFPAFGFVLIEQIDAHALRDAPQNLILIS